MIINRIRQRILRKAYAVSKARSRVNLYEYLSGAISEHGLSEPAATLNVGSGGEIEAAIRSAGASPISVDLDPKRKPDIIASVENLHMFDDESFDGVFCMEVLEHVADPFAAARELARVVRTGGVVIGSTPFLLGIHDAPYDYYRFTKYGILKLFEQLSQVSLRPRNGVFEAASVIPLRMYVVGTEEEKRKLARRWPILKIANWLYAIVGRGIGNTDATTGYFFVFRKGPEVATNSK